MIVSLQRRMEGGIRRTVSSLLRSPVTEAAGLPTCYGGPGIRVAQMGFTAQATFWLAVDLHLAVMPRSCDALGRLIVGQHPDCATGQVARTELLVGGVAVDLKACVQLEKDASTTYTESPWAQDMSADMVVSQAPTQSEELVPPRSVARRQLSLSCYHAFCQRLRQRRRGCTGNWNWSTRQSC